MNRLLLNLLGSSFIVLMLASCEGPAEYKKSPYLTDLSSFDQFRAKYQGKGSKYSFNYDYTVTTKRGIKLTFDREGFSYLDGNPVIGPVELEVLELYTKGDMILYNRPSVSGGEILDSQGFLRIRASQKGVDLLYNAPIDIEVPPGVAKPGMEMFLGTTEGDPQPTWTRAERSDSSSSWGEFGEYRTRFFTNSDLGWINCDRFYYSTDTSYTEISPVMQGFDPKNSAVFMLIDSLNSVLSVYPTLTGRYVTRNVPVGTSVTLIAISNYKSEFYYGVKKGQVGMTTVFELGMERITEATLKSTIENLK